MKYVPEDVRTINSVSPPARGRGLKLNQYHRGTASECRPLRGGVD